VANNDSDLVRQWVNQVDIPNLARDIARQEENHIIFNEVLGDQIMDETAHVTQTYANNIPNHNGEITEARLEDMMSELRPRLERIFNPEMIRQATELPFPDEDEDDEEDLDLGEQEVRQRTRHGEEMAMDGNYGFPWENIETYPEDGEPRWEQTDLNDIRGSDSTNLRSRNDKNINELPLIINHDGMAAVDVCPKAEPLATACLGCDCWRGFVDGRGRDMITPILYVSGTPCKYVRCYQETVRI